MCRLQKIIRAIKGVSIARFSDTLFCEPELYKAVSSKDLDKIKSLIESGVDINECSSNGSIQGYHVREYTYCEIITNQLCKAVYKE